MKISFNPFFGNLKSKDVRLDIDGTIIQKNKVILQFYGLSVNFDLVYEKITF